MINTDNFEEYLSRYCKRYGISKEEALTHRIVKEVEIQHRGTNTSYYERK